MVLDFRYADEEEGPATLASSPTGTLPEGSLAAKRVAEIALAVAVGAMPLSELRRSIERWSGAKIEGVSVDPVDVCGGEDSGCNSFLDRYLGAGADADEADEADLFKVA